jgi:hypothetical protein
MAGLEHIDALMREIGPLLDLEQVTLFDSGREWALVVDDTTVVHADYIEAGERLMLSIELGRPPEASRHRVYELLLLYNHAWPDTGGVRMALESEGGAVVQLFETDTADLDIAGLRNLLGGFIELARHWRSGITRDVAGGEPGIAADRMLMLGGIRG